MLVAGAELTGPELTGPELTGPELTGPELTGPEADGVFWATAAGGGGLLPPHPVRVTTSVPPATAKAAERVTVVKVGSGRMMHL